MKVERIDSPPLHTVQSLRALGWVIPDGFTAGDIFQHDRRVKLRHDALSHMVDGVSIEVFAHIGVNAGPIIDQARADDARRRHENLAEIGVIAPKGWFA